MVCELNKEPAKRGGGRKKKDPSLYSMTPAAIRMRAVVARRVALTGRTAAPNAKRSYHKRELLEDMTEAPGLKPQLSAEQHKCGVPDIGYKLLSEQQIDRGLRHFFSRPHRVGISAGPISNSFIDAGASHDFRDDLPFDGKRNTRGRE